MSSDRRPILSRPRLIATLLLSQLFLLFAITDLGILAGRAPGKSLFPLALFLPAIALCIFTKERREWMIASVWSLLLWGTAILAAIPLCDYSYDGNVYHQEIIAAICNGWTPGNPNPSGMELSLWSLHYAKGIEIAASAVVKFTGLIESGKGINIILCLIPGFMIYDFCKLYFPAMGRRERWLTAVVTVGNPVCIMQSLTYYIDFSKYIYTSLAIILLIEILSGRRREKWSSLSMLAMTIILASATKFNAFFEIGVVCIAAVILLIYRHRIRQATRLAIFCLIVAMTGVLLFGWHPYATNLLTAGHPLYPLMGEGAVDIMTGNTPPEFLDGNRFSNFFRSLFSFERLGADTRHGGFGPLMGPLLLLACLTVWKSRNLRGAGPVSLYIAVWILASCFFFEQSWWARYIAQLWILVPQGLIMAFASGIGTSPGARWWRIDAWGIGFLGFCSILLSGYFLLIQSGRVSLYRQTVKSVLSGETVAVYGLTDSYARQLKEMGITALLTDSLNEECYQVAHFGTIALPDAYPVMMVDSIRGAEIRRRLESLPFDYSPAFETDPKKLPK